jgi:serine/threonine-protein kinase
MALNIGTQLGSLEITALLGKGGMGEVYRARDLKLKREVAIKILPDEFARDDDRVSRFQREAEVLASLNHPNIAAIYDFEEANGSRFLVLELVDGETLADRLKRGPIPIDEALEIAKHICEALEAAHERGIIHRDLKPANIKLTPDGKVKVLDFGLAKAMSGVNAPLGPDLSNSPTLLSGATTAGLILGTAAYMSPEQAKARPVDRRADIWAFGCVLYEILTGAIAFSGDTVTETLAAVIKEAPDWTRLPAATPMRVRVLLQGCLQKDSRQRLRDIGDARISLDEVVSAVTDESATSKLHAVPAAARRTVLFSFAALVLGAVIAGLAAWNLKPSPLLVRPVTRFTITLPPDQQLAELSQPGLALSADGSKLAYVAIHSAIQQIFLRAMDSTETKPLTGTEGASNPFFSPDGKWLGFFADGKLKKVSVNGGSAQTLADAVNPRGGSWGSQGVIVFDNLAAPLQRVPEVGGTAQGLDSPGTAGVPGAISNLWPQFLPGGSAVVFSSFFPDPGIIVQRIGTGEQRNLVQGQPASVPRYLPSGHLLYVQAGDLMAIPFDLARLQVTGTPVPVAKGIQELGYPVAAQYSVSDTGTLAYVSGAAEASSSRLVWVNRNGAEEPLAAPPRRYDSPRISPDGKRIAVDIEESGNPQVWLYDLGRDKLSRFTVEGNSNQFPVWTSDGKRIAYQAATTNGQAGNIFWLPADGSGGAERLTDRAGYDVPFSWSPGSQLLAFIRLIPNTGDQVWVVRPSDDRKAERVVLPERFYDAPQLSPDGHWLAYTSDETGRREVYLQSYPGPGGKRQISSEGGTEPQWNPNGRELFYRDRDKMMAVEISTQAGFSAGKLRQLFEGHYLKNTITYARANYDVSPDGQRFLMLKPAEQQQSAPTQINVVLNWTEELKRAVPTR